MVGINDTFRHVRCENEKCRKDITQFEAVWLELNNKTGKFCEPGKVKKKESQGGFPFCSDCATQIRTLGHLDDGEGLLIIEANFSACLHVDRAGFNRMNEEDKKSCLVEHLAKLIEDGRTTRQSSDFPHDYDTSLLDRYKVIEIRDDNEVAIATACGACNGEGIRVLGEADGERFIERDDHGKPRVCKVCKGKKLLPGKPEPEDESCEACGAVYCICENH